MAPQLTHAVISKKTKMMNFANFSEHSIKLAKGQILKDTSAARLDNIIKETTQVVD